MPPLPGLAEDLDSVSCIHISQESSDICGLCGHFLVFTSTYIGIYIIKNNKHLIFKRERSHDSKDSHSELTLNPSSGDLLADTLECGAREGARGPSLWAPIHLLGNVYACSFGSRDNMSLGEMKGSELLAEGRKAAKVLGTVSIHRAL